MKRITQSALLLLALMSTSSLCFAQTGKTSDELPPPPAPAVEYNDSAWKVFTSPEGGFSIKMIGTPQPMTKDIDSPFGKLSLHGYATETHAGGYLVAYNDFPKYSESPEFIKALLDGGRDSLLSSDKNRKLLSEKEVTLVGHVGREVLVDDGKFVTRVRMFLVKGRLYQIVLVTPLNVTFKTGRSSPNPDERTAFYEEISKSFFDSFKLIPASGSEVQPTPDNPLSVIAPVEQAPKAIPAEPQTEGEVDRLLKSLREKGELVIGVCEEGAKCQPLPDIEGVNVKDKGTVVTIKVINKPQPAYPPIAKAARAQGTVTVQLVVDEEGQVIAAQAISGHPLLQAAAVKAAREIRFSPILLGTKPVKVSGVITYHFVLQ